MNLPEQSIEGKASATPGYLMKLMVRSHENDHTFYDEEHFRHILRVERMRTELSKKPFILMLLDISKIMVKYRQSEILAGLQTEFFPALREIDVRGWYHTRRTVGIIFAEVADEQDSFIDFIIHKISDRFNKKLYPDWINKIDISFHLFPKLSSTSFNNETFNISCEKIKQ